MKLGIAITSALALGLFAVNYFFSDGVRGASLLSFTLAFFLIMIIAPRSQYWLWLSLTLSIVTGLLFYEHYFPEDIHKAYQDLDAILLDMGSTFYINIIIIFAGLFYLKQAFYKERKVVEEKTQALEALNNEKTKLFSVLSHDLRSPLASISLYLEVINTYDLSLEERKKMEGELLASVNGTQEMLSNILSWSKRQLKAANPVIMEHNIADVLVTVIDNYKTLAKQKGISIYEEMDYDLTARTDTSMLEVVLRNLVTNAIKFTPVEGEIHVSAVQDNRHALITIRDNGLGIPAERQGDIFSLNIASTYGTRNEKGIGLGLYLCKEYTEAQQGKIWFESNPGEGTVFYLQFNLQ
ncbi:MAG TPA: HAMP domain-containing sensor histidine kinase [Chitinophaga sp.]|nr:HAMP domain-containing sensor histidine kinase [Chitinophaga sp.]